VSYVRAYLGEVVANDVLCDLPGAQASGWVTVCVYSLGTSIDQRQDQSELVRGGTTTFVDDLEESLCD
jgi:hypothetical protein